MPPTTEMASTTLGHHKPAGGTKAVQPKALKEFHVKELHDGSYHFQKHHGTMEKPMEEGSASDLDSVHDAIEDHMGSPNDGEGKSGAPGGVNKHAHFDAGKTGSNKKQGHEEKAHPGKDPVDSPGDVKPGKRMDEES